MTSLLRFYPFFKVSGSEEWRKVHSEDELGWYFISNLNSEDEFGLYSSPNCTVKSNLVCTHHQIAQ
jgi:hypothetical protein